jgi:hypothetical protein
MSRTLLRFLAVAPVFAIALPAQGQENKEKKSQATGPVEARLIANKDSYTLDLGGLTVDEYGKKVQDAAATGVNAPPPPKVSLTLELVNTGTQDVQLRVFGTVNVVTLQLTGPGAAGVTRKGPQPRFLIAPKIVTLAPGKSVQVPITSLAYGLRGLTHGAYWTAPGEYRLTASYQTALKPAPEGARDAGDGFGAVTLTTAPVKLTVKAP